MIYFIIEGKNATNSSMHPRQLDLVNPGSFGSACSVLLAPVGWTQSVGTSNLVL